MEMTVYYVHVKDYMGDRFVCDAGDHCYIAGVDFDSLRMVSGGAVSTAIDYMTQVPPTSWRRVERTLDEEIGTGKVLGRKTVYL